jgi:Asp-tRNA(Asn)/Glu-tRNA(Gln) amidotransferase C subunit
MRGNSEFEALFDYFTQKCVHEAKRDNKDEYVETLIDIEDIIREYLDRREEKGTPSVSDNTQLTEFFSNKLTNMYDDVADFSPFFRRNIISAVTSLARELRTKNDIDSYRTYMDLLLYYYSSDICLEGIQPDLKQYFISRYTRCISASIDDVLNSESIEKFQNAEDIWNETFESVADTLKIAVEKSDTTSYSEIVNSVDPSPRHSQYSVVHNSEGKRDDSSLPSEKKKFLKDIESERVTLFFALTGWAYHLLNDGKLTKENYKSIGRETINTRRNISQISEIYYKNMADSEMEGIPYWDNWDMAKQREKSIGSTMTRSSSTSWLQAFLCIELLRVGKDRSFDAGSFNFSENPLPVVQSIVGSAEKIESKLEMILQGEYDLPISRYGVNLDSLASAIVQLHKEAEEKFRELSRERVHEATLDPEKVAEFKQSMGRVGKSFRTVWAIAETKS